MLMDANSVTALHYRTGQAIRLRWDKGIIQETAPLKEKLAHSIWIAPALVDLQINGYAGADFQNDQLAESDLVRAARALREAGCAHFLLTLITDPWPRLMARLRRLRAWRDQSPLLRSAIIGWHIEGPFLSAEPGFCGAHDPACMSHPEPGQIDELREITGNDPVLVTMAPERPGVLEAIRKAVSLGMVASLGHTNAAAEVIEQAVKAGATGFTHLANGCPKMLDRHDNILWRVLEQNDLTVSLIPDGIHVSPPLFRLVHRARQNNSIYYTTDAMCAAGAGPGTYTIGRLTVEVGADQVVRQPGQTNFAGSALRPIEGLFRAARMLHLRWPDVWDAFSLRPCQLMKWPCGLETGSPATFCLLEFNEQSELPRLRLCVQGQWLEG